MDLQDGSHSVTQVDGISYGTGLPALWEGGLSKGTMASAHPDARHFSLSLYTTGALQAATSVLELKGYKSG